MLEGPHKVFCVVVFALTAAQRLAVIASLSETTSHCRKAEVRQYFGAFWSKNGIIQQPGQPMINRKLPMRSIQLRTR
jgi:hypothetical protein